MNYSGYIQLSALFLFSTRIVNESFRLKSRDPQGFFYLYDFDSITLLWNKHGYYLRLRLWFIPIAIGMRVLPITIGNTLEI